LKHDKVLISRCPLGGGKVERSTNRGDFDSILFYKIDILFSQPPFGAKHFKAPKIALAIIRGFGSAKHHLLPSRGRPRNKAMAKSKL